MKREEALQMGIKPEQLKQFHRVYWEDVKKAAERATVAEMAKRYDDAEKIRTAVADVLQLIHSPDRLHDVLVYATDHYTQMRREKGASMNAVENSDQL